MPTETGEPTSLENWILEGTDPPSSPAQIAGAGPIGQALWLSSLRTKTKAPLVVIFKSKSRARETLDNLELFLGAESLYYLPPFEFDFYKGMISDPQLSLERNSSLFHALQDPNKKIFITTVSALSQKAMPCDRFLNAVQSLSANDTVDREKWIQALLEAGYQRQPLAYDPGSFSVRGGVMDIFSPLYNYPVRVEFFDDLVEEIRLFDPSSQRSLEKIERAYFIPVGLSLFPQGEHFEKARLLIKERLDSLNVPKNKREELIDSLQQGLSQQEGQLLFPLLSGGSQSVSSYFPKDSLWIWEDEAREIFKENSLPQWQKQHGLFEKELNPVAPFEDLFLPQEEFDKLWKEKAHYLWQDFKTQSTTHILKGEPVQFTSEKAASDPKNKLAPFASQFKGWMEDGISVHMICHTQTHAERAQFLFSNYGIRSEIHSGEKFFPHFLRKDFSRLHLWIGGITHSESFTGLRSILINEEEIFGAKKRIPHKTRWVQSGDASQAISSFRDLKAGDYIVHKDHGIGKYLGLKSMSFLGEPNDYVHVEYRDGDKLYVPVYRLNVIQKYVGAEAGSPLLDKLGGERWQKAKKKAEKAAQELAAELLQIQARRKLVKAHAFAPPGPEYQQFEMAFPFDETPDQLKAIGDAMKDLSQDHPMDRLLVGDVGYGKTECALRAAYRVALEGKQVALLVPTTVLAFQHFETCKLRFKDTALNIEMISRLRSPKQNKDILQKLKTGKIDLIIGTHRLLSQDVEFKDLGLVVVDEEHRFGVVQKERLKKMCHGVHVLAMTATPIPRTLHMAMAGIKDISLITTPPPDRLAVRTFVCRSSDEVLYEALSNELTRGGQIFFLHNRIQSIHLIAEKILELFPKIRMEVAHGQMDAESLENKMLHFYQGKSDVLLCTTIIESGLDVPNANTIIMDEAHKLGLAQAYQLRGRVGRSNRRAYCYFLVPPEGTMTEEARQRLQVLQRFSELGSGFSVASHDLEIRGAGDLLGKEQSGHINAIGIDLYFDLLEESLRYLKGQKAENDIEPEISIKVKAYFPEDYLPDIGERINIYRKLSGVKSEEEISQIESEIRDRFGSLPDEVINLLGLMKIKLYLKILHVTHLSCGPQKTSLKFAATTPVTPEKVVHIIQRDPENFSLTPDHKLVFKTSEGSWGQVLDRIKALGSDLGIEA